MKKRKIKDNYFCKLTIDIYPYYKNSEIKFNRSNCKRIFSYLKKLNSGSIDLPEKEFGIKKIILDYNYGKRLTIIDDRILHQKNNITEVLSDKNKIIKKLILVKINNRYRDEIRYDSYLNRGKYNNIPNKKAVVKNLTNRRKEGKNMTPPDKFSDRYKGKKNSENINTLVPVIISTYELV